MFNRCLVYIAASEDRRLQVLVLSVPTVQVLTLNRRAALNRLLVSILPVHVLSHDSSIELIVLKPIPLASLTIELPLDLLAHRHGLLPKLKTILLLWKRCILRASLVLMRITLEHSRLTSKSLSVHGLLLMTIERCRLVRRLLPLRLRLFHKIIVQNIASVCVRLPHARHLLLCIVLYQALVTAVLVEHI